MKRNSILVLIIMLMILGCGKNVPVKEDITEDEESFVEWVLTIEDSVDGQVKALNDRIDAMNGSQDRNRMNDFRNNFR